MEGEDMDTTDISGCYFCGPVKNCARYLKQVLQNIELIGNNVFHGNYKIIVFYDHSTDNSLQILKKYQATHPDKFHLYINTNRISHFRTYNLAYARNTCLRYIYSERLYPLFAMMDFDDVNANGKKPNCKLLQTYLSHCHKDKWDCLSFNTVPHYYDIWALSIYPYCFSYNHFQANAVYSNVIKDHVTALLKRCAKQDGEGAVLNTISAFNGFAIYKLDKFVNCYYDGKVNPNLIPKNMMDAHKQAVQGPLIFRVYPGVADCRFEDCEHRSLHVQAFQNNGAKIKISPYVLFS